MTSHQPVRIGDTIGGRVTGVQPYGVFMLLDNGEAGLIHISEIKQGFVSDLETQFAVGQPLIVKVLDVDEYTGKISLSLRILHPLSIPHHPYRNHQKRRFKGKITGFDPLKAMLPQWEKEALALIEKGKIKNYQMEGK